MIDQLAMTTDYVTGRGNPQPHLRAIAAAGFRSVHWCHEWNTDCLYSAAEVDRIGRWLAECGLTLNDVHASAGARHSWGSLWPWRRRAGIELVKNRIAMTRRLGSDVIVMHAPKRLRWESHAALWTRFRHTLDALRPHALEYGVRIALENMALDNSDFLEKALDAYEPDFLGLCYDAGHGHIAGNGLDRLDRLKDRLIALHLHDNDGVKDRHWPLFRGTVDWPRLARIIAASGYTKPALTIESNMRYIGRQSESEFLKEIMTGGRRFAEMVEAARSSLPW